MSFLFQQYKSGHSTGIIYHCRLDLYLLYLSKVNHFNFGEMKSRFNVALRQPTGYKVEKNI